MFPASSQARSRPCLFLVVCSCIAVLLSSCTERQPIVIGFAASLSGSEYLLGVEGRNAAALFIQEANEAGGLRGRPLQLEIRDLASDDSTVSALTRELADAGAVLIVGYYTSDIALAAIAIPEAERVPIISPSATSDMLTGRKDGFFRTIMSSRDDGFHIARHMKTSGYEQIVILGTTSNAAYVDTYAVPLGQELDVCADLRFTRIADIDYQLIESLASRAGGKGYQAVMIIASAMDTGTLAQELSIRGLMAPLYVSGWAGSDDLVTFGGKAVDGACFVHQTDLDHPGVKTLAERYTAVYGTRPGFSAIQTWDAMILALDVVRKAGVMPERIARELQSRRSFEGLAGTIRLDEYGDVKRDLFLKRVDGTRIVTIGVLE